jgi:hypothetical protein
LKTSLFSVSPLGSRDHAASCEVASSNCRPAQEPALFTPLDDVAHVIQTALTPAFLLAALAGLLGVFASRLDGVANRVEQLSRQIRADEHAHDYCVRELTRLHHRSKLLDAAVVLGAIGGGLSCVAALLLFIGGFGRSVAAANVLLAAFGLALTMTIGSIAAFVGEMALSSRAIRAEISVRQSHDGSGRLSKK